MKQTPHKHNSPPVPHVNANLPLVEQIAERAHELWQHSKGAQGNDLTHWFQAEREISEWHQREPTTQPSHHSGATMARP